MIRKGRFWLLQGLLIASLLAMAGCTSGGSEPQTPAGEATQASPLPSVTPTAPRPTVAATPLPSPTAASEEKPEPELLAQSLSTSPDGQWLAESSLAYVTEGEDVVGYDTKLRVSRIDGTATWLLVDRVQGAGFGFEVPEVVRWSADGRTLYFTNRPVPDGCAPFVNGSNLSRADLETGEVVELMPALARSLALSTDASRVAYLPWGPAPNLMLHDLATGTERQITLDIPLDNTGNFIWSPDGQSLVLVQAADPCSNTTTHTIIRVDLETGTTETLLEGDARQFTVVDWPEMNTLRLQDKDGGLWQLDPETGKLEPE